MTDTHALKAQCDLRRLVEQDLGPAPLHGGRAHLYKCPFHHEQKGYSLAVWADGYRCFGACHTHGDALDWLMHYRQLTFNEALAVLGDKSTVTESPQRTVRRTPADPPDLAWQHRAERVVTHAEEALWSSEGESALKYLLGRGLSTATIRQARLGYVSGDYRARRTLEGLEVPCGITIPWFAAGALWAVKVRRAYGTPKYLQIAGGSAAGLYNVDAMEHHPTVVFCEGEFDALLTAQEARGLSAAVTLGSATNSLAPRWLGELVNRRLLLVAYDQDEAGRRGAQRLLQTSPRFRPLSVPFGHDITDFYLDGGDLYAWIAEAIQQNHKEVMP